MGFDEMYDSMLHDEFRDMDSGGPARRAAHAAPNFFTENSRRRTIAIVASGSVACAAVGAFLGGLGGYLGIFPAAAHPVTSSAETVPLSSVASAAFQKASVKTPAVAAKTSHVTDDVSGSTSGGSAAATFVSSVGGLLSGTAATEVPVTAPATTLPVVVPTTPGVTNPGTEAVDDISIGLNGIMTNLTKALTGIVALPGDPTAGLTGVTVPLTGVFTSLTSTLANLSGLLTTSLPTGGGGTLPAITTAAPSTTDGPSVVDSPTDALSPVTKSPTSALSSVKSTVDSVLSGTGLSKGSSGQGLPSVPTVNLPTTDGPAPTIPATPVTVTLPALPPITLPTTGTGGTTGTPTCVSTPSVPTGSVPPIVGGTISIGPVSVGVSVGGKSTGVSVCATS